MTYNELYEIANCCLLAKAAGSDIRFHSIFCGQHLQLKGYHCFTACVPMQKKQKTENLLTSSVENRSLPRPEASDSHEGIILEPHANGHRDNQSDPPSREPNPTEPFSNCNGEHYSTNAEINSAEVVDPNTSQPSASSEAQSSETSRDSDEREPSKEAALPEMPIVQVTESSALSSDKRSAATDPQQLALKSAFEDLKIRAKQMEHLLADCNRMAAGSTKKVFPADSQYPECASK